MCVSFKKLFYKSLSLILTDDQYVILEDNQRFLLFFSFLCFLNSVFAHSFYVLCACVCVLIMYSG